MRRSAREATAYHEAGHMVAAWRLGMKIRRATIIPAEDYAGKVHHESPLKGINLEIDGSDRAEMKADKAVLICLAGPVTQRCFRPTSWRRHHGRSDYDLATDLALRLHGDGEMATAYLGWMSKRAERLVSTNWKFVEAFAASLLAKHTLAASDVPKIIQQVASQGRPHPHIRTKDEIFSEFFSPAQSTVSEP